MGLRVISRDSRETQLAATVKLGSNAIKTKLREIDNIVYTFFERCRRLKASHIGIFGTEAIRQICIEHHQELSRIASHLVILDKKSEALCSLIAAIKGLPARSFHGNEVLTIDQGAGSMEVAIGQLANSDIGLTSYKSYKLGTQTLASSLLKKKGDLVKLKAEIKRKIKGY